MLSAVLCRGQLQLHPQHVQQSVANASVVDHAPQLAQLHHHVPCFCTRQDAVDHQHLHFHAMMTQVHSVEPYVVCVVSLVVVMEDEAADLFQQVHHLLSGRANTQITISNDKPLFSSQLLRALF